MGKIYSSTSSIKLTPSTGTGDVGITLEPSTVTFGTHTLVSGTAYAPTATHAVLVTVTVTHAGKLTWQLLTAATATKVKYCTAISVTVGDGYTTLVPPGFKVKFTAATSLTLSAMTWVTI